MAVRSLGQLTLDVIAKIGGFEKGMDAAERRSKRAAEKIAKDQKKAAEQVERAFLGMAGKIGGIFAAGQLFRGAVRLADSFTLLNARLGLVTKSSLEFATAQEEVYRISQRTRAGLEETTNLYVSLARSTADLGVSQKEVLGVTETINQALIISGGSAQAAAAALVQLGQGLSSGTLRGDELRSVLEQAPRLARAIADGMGVSIGELRQLGADGELTATRVFEAIQKSADKIQQEFDRMPVTVGQALTRISNSTLLLVGNMDKATSASSKFASILTGISNVFDKLANSENNTMIAQFTGQIQGLEKRLKSLREDRDNRLGKSWFGDVDKDIAETERKLKLAQAKFAAYSVTSPAGQQMYAANNEFASEQRRLGIRAPTNIPEGANLNRNTIAGIQATIKALKEQRDAVAINSSEFKRLNAEIQSAEKQLQSLIGKDSGRSKGRLSEAEKFIETLKGQLQATKDLSVLEETIIELQNKKYATILPAQKEEILNLAKQIDLARKLKEEEEERWEIIRMRRESIIAEGEAVDKANEAYQKLVQGLVDQTPLAQLQKQEEAMQALAHAFAYGQITSEQYNQALDKLLENQNKKIKEQKSLAEELGLSFTSAFEDAIVSGKSFSEVLKGLAQDIMRIVTRKLVTEPLGNALTSMFSGAFGGIFGGGRATGGPVMPNRLYEVNENGPEMLEMGGRQYLMMGNQAGRVIPTSQAKGGNNINVNVTAVPGMTRDTALQQGARIGTGIQLAMTRNT